MKTTHISFILIFFWTLSVCPSLFARKHPSPIDQLTLERSLQELDSTILQKPMFHKYHEAKLDSFKRELNLTNDLWKAYHLCGSLFYEYLHFQADSSLYYIERKAQLLPLLKAPHLQDEIHINRAEVYNIKGMYTESLAELQATHPRQMTEGMRRYYYSVYANYYAYLANYHQVEELDRKYKKQSDLYRDSVFMLLPPGTDRKIVFADKLMFSHKPEEAIQKLKEQLRTNKDTKRRVYLYYVLSDAYAMCNDSISQMYYLAQTAIQDLHMSVREYAALQKLGWLLYKQGNLERAYNYLKCSMNDAFDCNSRLRFAEIKDYSIVVDKAYIDMQNQKYVTMRRTVIVTVMLVVLMLASISTLVYWMKKLQRMKRLLAENNEQLTITNHNLAITGKIKEAYIGRYLSHCVEYIEKLDQYRRSLVKLAMASKIEELFKTLRSEKFIKEERENFYKEFDRSFLDLFPNFVNDFNQLLPEDQRTYPKPGELLNTELRVFALIRLGVTETANIAYVLGYSLSTVYNYRSRFRLKALHGKDLFEQEVMAL